MLNEPPMADYEVLFDDQNVWQNGQTSTSGPVIININTVNVNNDSGYVGSGYTGYTGELYSNKSRAIALILALFFGYFGAHCFYAGRVGRGLLFLFTFGLLGFGWVWDIIMILIGRFRDGAGWLIVT